MNTSIFYRVFLFWIFWILLATLLGWIGFFHARIFWIFLSITICYFAWESSWKHFHPSKKIKNEKDTSKEIFFFIGVIIFILTNTFIFFQPQTLFTGRDQGSIAQASYFLAEKHSFHFKTKESSSFFEAYGEGQALHFPGFYYDSDGNLTTQFPHPTIAWYASLLAIGIPSPFHIMVGNAITLFLFFLSFYFILSHFFKKKIVYIFSSLLLFSFPIWWFSRFSLTENVMMASLWITLFFFLRFLESPDTKKYLFFLSSCFLLLIVRVEGPIFVALMGISFFLFSNTRTFLKRKFFQRILIPLFLISSFFLVAVFANIPFFTIVAKAILETLGLRQPNDLTLINIANISIFNLWKLLFLYGVGVLIFSGILGAIFLFKKKLFLTLPHIVTILFVLSPGLIYLFVPFISPDHPWMFRRFTFATIGFFILILAYISHLLIEKKIFYSKKKPFLFCVTLLFLTQAIPFLFFFTLKQDESLLEQVKLFGQNFEKEDLILIDKSASGNGFVMFPGVLTSMGLSSAYFFNSEDFSKVNFSQFKRVFLLVREDSLKQYGNIPEEDGQKVIFNDYRLASPENTTSFSFPTFSSYTAEDRLLIIP
ncbi:MAG: hypothetical protein IPN70_04500 [Candidatus Moraniibacteriota bacterium]|nr:MAG: hypothetical protein IPN70_04500 [Candidatus Moranbacteria bacterium]